MKIGQTMIWANFQFKKKINSSIAIYLFISGCAASSWLHAWAFFNCGEWRAGGYSWFAVLTSLVMERGLYGTQAQQLWHRGLIALWRVESSWIRDPICVPCIGGWILNHWTMREALTFSIIYFQVVQLLYLKFHPTSFSYSTLEYWRVFQRNRIWVGLEG